MLFLVLLFLMIALMPFLLGYAAFIAILPIFIKYVIPIVLIFYWISLIHIHFKSTISLSVLWFICYFSEIFVGIYAFGEGKYILSLLKKEDFDGVARIVIYLIFFFVHFMAQGHIVYNFPDKKMWFKDAESQYEIDMFYKLEKENFYKLDAWEFFLGTIASVLCAFCGLLNDI